MSKLCVTTVEKALALPENNGSWSERMQQRIATWQNQTALQETMAGEVLLKHILGIDEFLFDISEINGKPFFNELNVVFSVSHSKGVACCIVGSEGVSVDTEAISSKCKEVLSRIATEEEKSFAGEDNAKWTFLWTARECAVKYGFSSYYNFKNVVLTALNGSEREFCCKVNNLSVVGFLFGGHIVSVISSDKTEIEII